jgi:tRNA dimethylallyltransferase
MLVGGTGFFLKALTHPMFEEPELNQDRLARLRAYLNGLSDQELQGFLAVLDPDEDDPPPGDRQRWTRKIEMALLTGRPLSWWHEESGPALTPLSGVVVLLDLPRDSLYERINARVGRMVEEGLVQEVETLLNAGYVPDHPGMTGAGYREIVGYLQGQATLEAAAEEIRQTHRRYARRQITWFRHQLPGDHVAVDGSEDPRVLTDQVLRAWTEGTKGGNSK